MFKDLIYKENKVFSTPLKSSESIEALLSKTKEKEDLSTAIVLIEGKAPTKALFILENKWYAAYGLDVFDFSPLIFSGGLKEASGFKGELQLYQVSPVLFKCLLIFAQYLPSVVGTTALIDIERILAPIREQKKEAVLVFKKKSQVQLFYFMNGKVCDTYFTGQNEIRASQDLKAQLIAAAKQDPEMRIELFDETEIKAAHDRESAEERIAEAPAMPAQNEDAEGENQAADVQAGLDIPDPPSETAEENARGTLQDGNGTAVPSFEKAEGERLLCVKVLSGSRAGFLIRFSPDPVSLGRGNVAVRLNDPQVSRFHAELTWGQDGLFIRDNHSTNGILVNDEKVDQKTLRLNDVIRLGDVRLKVVRGS